MDLDLFFMENTDKKSKLALSQSLRSFTTATMTFIPMINSGSSIRRRRNNKSSWTKTTSATAAVLLSVVVVGRLVCLTSAWTVGALGVVTANTHHQRRRPTIERSRQINHAKQSSSRWPSSSRSRPLSMPSSSSSSSSSSSALASSVAGGASTVLSAIPPLIHNLRGGAGAAAAAAALNLSRESYLIQEMATYGTLTALVMNAALRLWTSVKFKKEQPVEYYSFIISTALCVISGAFCAILFQLLGIYSKSALGMVNDDGYRAFQAATAIYRKWGFRCFLTELGSFVFSFLLSVYQKLWQQAQDPPRKEGEIIPAWKRPGTYIMAGCILLVTVGVIEIKNILDLATKHIYIQAFHDKFA